MLIFYVAAKKYCWLCRKSPVANSIKKTNKIAVFATVEHLRIPNKAIAIIRL